jgi:uncharacterized membrane protein YagU involved in acid resistance
MSIAVDTLRAPRWSQVLNGGLLIAAADFVFFSGYWWPQGVTPWRIFQGIAVGVLGKASYDGGAASVVLGAALHVLIATLFVLAYTLAARRLPALIERPALCGPLYGFATYVAMNYVVMPLSRIGHGPSNADMLWTLGSILFHLIVVGLMSALFARRALREIAAAA